jgi:polar amino acid transport system substrate-binding protein
MRIERLFSHASALTFAHAAILALLVTAVPAQARPLDEVVESKVLRVVLYDDNEPFSWTDNGTPRGIEVDLARAIANKLGVEAEVTLRMQGEKLDADLRANVIRGTVGGGIAGDVMLHVPIDKEMGIRIKEAVMTNAYFRQEVALAVKPDRTAPIASFDVFKTEKVGVQMGTVADYFLMRFDNGALVNNVSHHIKPLQGVEGFAKGETGALMGVRSNIEALLKSRGVAAAWVNPPTPGLVRSTWVLGTAVNERSRDLSYAIGAALDGMRADGTLASIYAVHGVTYLAPAN